MPTPSAENLRQAPQTPERRESLRYNTLYDALHHTIFDQKR
jgi:hypothetical protein